MNINNSATLQKKQVISLRGLTHSGLWWGFIGIFAFSFTVPFTRIAVIDGSMSPLFVGSARAVIAALCASIALIATRQKLPQARQWVKLAIVGLGVVIGFPFLTSFALTMTPASHSAVIIAMLPAATSVAAVMRGSERPPLLFWVMACIGSLVAIGFACFQSTSFNHLQWSDLLLFLAVIAAATGYAEGGILARELGAWQTISWSLLLCSPVMLLIMLGSLSNHIPHPGISQWFALAYLSFISMFLGFFAWYRGLALGPMVSVSQIQLIQPVLSLIWAVFILDEKLNWQILLGGFVIILCAATTVRIRLQNKLVDFRINSVGSNFNPLSIRMSALEQWRAEKRLLRIGQLLLGLWGYGSSLALLVSSGLGASSWAVLAEGMSKQTRTSFGMATNLIAVLVLICWVFLRELPGLGTILNVCLLGVFADDTNALLHHFHLNLISRLIMFIGGFLLFCFSDALYLGARFGSGPRDGLMTGLVRITHRPLWQIRICLDIIVALSGFLLGGQLGAGTIIMSLGAGPLIHRFLTFTIVHLQRDNHFYQKEPCGS